MLTIAGGIVLGGIALFLIFVFLEDIIKLGIVAILFGVGLGLLYLYIIFMEEVLGQYKAYGIVGGIGLAYCAYYLYKSKKLRDTKKSEIEVENLIHKSKSIKVDVTDMGEDEVRDLCIKYNIGKDGDSYTYGNYRYSKVQDAINYAKLNENKT